ncbi:MAG: hypothetical protein OK454_09090 [Thaumarchaeota archaeon]|nr:hypothetical protein [Nitrososphaerota archaeon]
MKDLLLELRSLLPEGYTAIHDVEPGICLRFWFEGRRYRLSPGLGDVFNGPVIVLLGEMIRGKGYSMNLQSYAGELHQDEVRHGILVCKATSNSYRFAGTGKDLTEATIKAAIHCLRDSQVD